MTGLTGEFSGVVDRIVDKETAIVLVEDGETQAELTLPVEELPERATEGAVLHLVLSDGDLTDVDYRDEETDSRGERLEKRLDNLSRKLSKK